MRRARMRRSGRALAGTVALAVATALLAAGLGAAAPRPGEEIAGKVVKVKDGDSMDLRRGGENVGVRVFGVDSPERGQPWSSRARSFTAALVGNQDVVVVVKDVDRYGRIVGDVKLKDGRDLGRELLRAGLAWYYHRYANDPALEKLEGEARAAKRGLWSEPRPVPPWKFRAGQREPGRDRRANALDRPAHAALSSVGSRR